MVVAIDAESHNEVKRQLAQCEADGERMAAEIERLTAALESCASWIDRWTAHVGRCEGGTKCTCGRTAVLAEAHEQRDEKK